MAKRSVFVTVPEYVQDEGCKYCGRVQWGNYRYLGNGHWSHAECAPGSQNWLEWYAKQTPEVQEKGGKELAERMGWKK